MAGLFDDHCFPRPTTQNAQLPTTSITMNPLIAIAAVLFIAIACVCRHTDRFLEAYQQDTLVPLASHYILVFLRRITLTSFTIHTRYIWRQDRFVPQQVLLVGTLEFGGGRVTRHNYGPGARVWVYNIITQDLRTARILHYDQVHQRYQIDYWQNQSWTYASLIDGIVSDEDWAENWPGWICEMEDGIREFGMDGMV